MYANIYQFVELDMLEAELQHHNEVSALCFYKLLAFYDF